MDLKKLFKVARLSSLWQWRHSLKRSKVMTEPFDTEFFKDMETAVENNHIGLDVKTGIFFMTTQFYNAYLCDGPMTLLNDPKAHSFFHMIRQWINIHRGVYNGETGSALTAINDDDVINFGVLDAEGNFYIVGKERRNLLLVSFNKEKNNANIEDNEGNTQV